MGWIRDDIIAGRTKAEIWVEIEGVTYRRSLPIPEPYWDEAERRMLSDTTDDGLRHCLNRCFLPFYTWVREQTKALYDEKIAEYCAAHPEDTRRVPTFEEIIPAHSHIQTAPHWFERELAEA